MAEENNYSHKGFIRTSGVFIALNFLSTLFELGFNGVVARLPEGDYGIYGRLFGVFFIITVPFVSIQLMVSKEVSSFFATGRTGRAGTFVKRSLKHVTIIGAALTLIGIAASQLIADFLSIESAVPVVLLMIIIGCYSPFPVLLGTVQGMKKFYTIGIIAIVWGVFRFTSGALALWVFAWKLNGILVGVIFAVVLTVIFAWINARSVFMVSYEELGKREFRRAYTFVFPIALTLFFVTVLRSIDLVIAGRFFDDATVDAYTCAVQVGKAFFMLTTIIMVMFPLVSEQRSLKRDPFIYLVKSLIVTVGLSLFGIVISWFFPEFVMRIITVGEFIPGAGQLIKIVGLVILPVSIIYIMANYFLAQHKAGFIPILFAGMVLQCIIILLFHETPLRLLCGVGTANFVTLFLMVIFLIIERRKYAKSL